MLHLKVRFMNRFDKTDIGIFISCVISLLPKDLLYRFYCTCAPIIVQNHL